MNEYQEKIAIKNRLAKYYRNQSKKTGLSDMKKIKAYLPEELMFRHLRRDIIIAHMDFEHILEMVVNNQEFVVISGLNPSSPLHLGHKTLFDLLIDLQKIGGRVYIPLTNDESYFDGKAQSINESQKLASEEILPSIISFGFHPEKTHIYIDTDYYPLYLFAIKLSKYVSFDEVVSLFGKESLINPGQIFYRGCVQLAQILLPQLPEFGGPKHTLIPVGIDQHPYILLARDVAKRLKLIPPSELVIKFQPGLKNPEEKMSGSKPETAIYLNDSEAEIARKINSAYTGAVRSLEEHKKLGAVPEICSVYALLNSQFENEEQLEKIYQSYKKGILTTKELKEFTIQVITQIVCNRQAKCAQVKNKELFLLKHPIQSCFN